MPLGQFDTPGIDHGEGHAAPLGVGIEAVAGRARHLGDDGQTAAEDAIE